MKRFPDVPSVRTTEHKVTATDGSEIILQEFRDGDRATGKATGASCDGSATDALNSGGMILGSVEQWAPSLKIGVQQSGVPYFAIEYRLAPEHPHPTPVNDCYAGLKYLSSHAAELGVDPARIVVAGDSAGGGLAAGTVLKARDEGLSPEVAAQQLIYPMLDDRNMTPIPEIEPFASWACNDNITGWTALLGKKAAGSKEESAVAGHLYAAPARAKDLRGLPSTYIDVGQLDIFASENIAYASRLVEAGVPTEFHLYPGVPHAFEAFGSGTKIVQAALARRTRWLADQLS
ncbi:hypothetical protein EJ03DRAFT_275219 [Teratosphaeria nubilosa]|uniref:Alpha/beta hydrolase fold-3 domain-containing protein n=1 Tax=Teratosphaeria nubilosa TaxID=161662 RepID=A0A6G1L4Y4_9PEZI|nr:hypothetical protein EJ03DRAFT_275219 [Teratosphaeria nubilosa]